MPLSRRDFIGSGIALLGSSALTPPGARGWTHGSVFSGLGQGQVNLQSFVGGAIDWPFINCAKNTQGWYPTGGTASADPYTFVNSDGYPTALVTGTSAWRMDTNVYYLDYESFFSGSVSGTTLTVTGSVTGKALFVGQTIAQTSNGTAVTAQSRITAFGTGTGGAGTYTLNQSSSSTGAISMTGFIPWVIDWVGNSGNITAGVNANGAANDNTTAPYIAAQRIEINIAAASRTPATFTLSLTHGTSTGTVSSVSGTLFPEQYITGQGLPVLTRIGGIALPSVSFQFSSNSSDPNGGGTLSYDLTNIACTGAQIAQGDSVGLTLQMTTISSTPSNIRIYRQDQEALLNAGKITPPHFINYYKQYGRLRFMNYLKTNGSVMANWADRTPTTFVGWYANMWLPTKYAGLCPASTKNQYVGINAAPGNPSSWTDKQTVQFTVNDCPAACNIIGFIDNGAGGGSYTGVAGNTLTVTSTISGTVRIGLQIRGVNSGTVATCTITAGSGSTWTVSGSAQGPVSQQMLLFTVADTMSNASTCSIVCNAGHGLTTGDQVIFPFDSTSNFSTKLSNGGGTSGSNFSNLYTATVVNSTTFTIPVDTTSFPTYNGGGVFMVGPTFATGLLPAKPLIGQGIGCFTVPGAQAMITQGIVQKNTLMTGVYDSTLDAIITTFGNNAAGASIENEGGVPFEVCIQMANEVNGPDPWIPVPAFFTDSAVNSLATYMAANLNSNLKWCFEMSNEVWNPAGGFWQTPYANAIATLKWPSTVSSSSTINQWFGWRWNGMRTQVDAVYGTKGSGGISGRVWRIFSFRVDDTSPSTRYTPSATGISTNLLLTADSLCFATYFSVYKENVKTLPDAQTIYTYQQGFINNNSTQLTTALNRIDQLYNAPGCSPLFNPITAKIDNGSGGAGNTLTVTNIQNTSPASSNPQIGPGTVIGSFGSSSPAVGTFVDFGNSTGGTGTYTLSGPAQNIASTTFSAYPGWFTIQLDVWLPQWSAIAAAAGNIEFCGYEGGNNTTPSSESQYTSYLGNPINVQDVTNLEYGYLASSQFATSYLNFLHACKAQGMKFVSQYCMASFYGNSGNMYGLTQPDIFGASLPAKTNGFDVYNAGN